MQASYYDSEELADIGFKSIGDGVLISKKASIYSPDKISIGNNVRIDDFCILSGGSGIVLHNHIHIGAFSGLFGGGGIEMEDFSGLSPYCVLLSESDDPSGLSMVSPVIPPEYKPTYQSGKILLKRHSGVGIRSTVLPRITLGEGSVVVAQSLANRNTEPWYLYYGVPARKLHARKQDILELEKKFLSIFNKSNHAAAIHE